MGHPVHFICLPAAPRLVDSRARHGGGKEEARADEGGRRAVPGTALAAAAAGRGTLAGRRCA